MDRQSIYTMIYYLTIKRNKVLIHVTNWMNPENIMLSERSQSPKDHILYGFIYINCEEYIIQSDRKWLPGDEGREECSNSA